MNPIFNEYCQFLRDMTVNEVEVPELERIKEGYFWLDKSIIKAFDKQGNIHKILRISIADNLKYITLSKLKNYSKLDDIDLASWNDLIELNKQHLIDIVDKSIIIIKEKMENYNDYIPIVPVSTGKDSMVTVRLVRDLYPDTHVIFNNTTLDCSDTYKIVKSFPDCEIMTPKEGFYQYIDRVNVIPTRTARFCCRIFKVGEMVNRLDHEIPYLLFMGMRNQESNTRSDYGDEWVNDAEWGETKWQGILPIREWSELDIWLFTFWRGLEINSKYRKGYARVGCAIACPYYTKSTWILDIYWYPVMRKRWEDRLRKDFIENKKWIIMNCTIDEYINSAWNGGTYRNEPTPEVIQEYADFNEIAYDVAANYFNKYCINGCKSTKGKLKKIKDKNTLSMNMKFYGRNTSKFMCKKCFLKAYQMSEDDWNHHIQRFKDDGCTLF